MIFYGRCMMKKQQKTSKPHNNAPLLVQNPVHHQQYILQARHEHLHQLQRILPPFDHQLPRVSHRIDQHDLPVNLLINQADDHRDNLPPNHLVDQPFNQADSPHVNLPPSQHDVQVDNQAVDHHVCQLHNPQDNLHDNHHHNHRDNQH